MIEGEIIKFYREKMGLTQAMLGEGICTTTHVSKIERGKTAYSPDIIALFSDRLGININHEVQSFYNLEKKLHLWHDALIMKKEAQIEEGKAELEQMPFIEYSQYAAHYNLLRARYYFHHQNLDMVKQILTYVKKEFSDLSPFEKNLFYHLQGMYYISNYTSLSSEDHQKAIKVLKMINIDEYRNEEFYHHLAIAYHYGSSKILAYKYAEMALKFFQRTNNYLFAISSETLMLLQYGSELEMNFNEVVERYKDLIHNCEVLGDRERKAILLNNLGVKYFKREEYETALYYFEESINETENKKSINYLRRLCNYLETCTEGTLLEKEILLSVMKRALALAKMLKSPVHITLIKLFKLKAEGAREKYYQYLSDEALPFFYSTNNKFYIEQFGKKLYKYYIEIKEFQKAAELYESIEDTFVSM
ncbi:helix-turn-helix domain-containing protein [Bacillus sp. AFS041924]|uniref:helix-turn-helix domain-containing protein n=1 Tax=Bacillus sp. AFS041924 TaxID=2033503 RepID=UPI000BFDFA84|nr:helix-turn-helix transcriptional regulator [Bacillus sp. AFS041924]PGS55833.1 transcriptional regulator [Bacillus sp. AFS041924]